MNIPPNNERLLLDNAIVLAYERQELTRLNAWIESLTEQLSLSPRLSFRLELAVTEAVTNVIEYGHSSDDDQQIEVTLAVIAEQLHITIVDQGPSFDPLQRSEHVTPHSLENAAIGGLGIHLYRKFTDECVYAYREGQNELKLIFHQATAPPA